MCKKTMRFLPRIPTQMHCSFLHTHSSRQQLGETIGSATSERECGREPRLLGEMSFFTTVLF